MTDFTCLWCHLYKHNRAVFCQNQPVFCIWTCWRCSWQRTDAGYPGGSSLIPPPILRLGWWSWPDVFARQPLKCWTVHIPTFQKVQNIAIPFMHTKTKSWLLEFFSFCSFLPHSKKASTDYRQFVRVRDMNKDKRMSFQMMTLHTWQSHKDDFCHFWHKVSSPDQQLSQLSHTLSPV